MKLKINSVDVLQIAKALKSGWLDTDRIESFKSLVEGYNPPKEIKREELDYYLDSLYNGCGYVPTDKETIKENMLQGLDSDLLEKWEEKISNNTVYKTLVKDAFMGMVAIKALGGTFTDKEPDFCFMENDPPKFK